MSDILTECPCNKCNSLQRPECRYEFLCQEKMSNDTAQRAENKRLITKFNATNRKYHEQATRIAELEEEVKELLVDVVGQHCACRDGTLDSMAISTNAQAMRRLAELNIIEITDEAGRRVLGKWKE